ncbi:MAG: SufD family Fe-S cluster assembly protein [Candidatus Aenigmarchaeota archaeon]|nr:SufD family Fe-S cluster assembly protein [Candidatus Aenigmarchaeota archaeon]
MYIVTVSKLLAEQIQILGARLGIFFRITKVYDAKQNFIQNRKVNVNTKYDVRCNLSEKIQAKILDKFILVPIRKIEQKYYKGLVYNIETTDHTYLVSNAVTHNCDALLIDENSRTDTYPYNEIHDDTATITHEATVGKIGEDMLFYLMSRGLGEQDALNMVVMGFFEPFAKEIPLEYALEFNRLIQLEMAGSVG